MKKRLLSLLLAALMILSLLPTAALAAVRDEDAIPMTPPAAAEDSKTSPATPAVVAEAETPAVPVDDDAVAPATLAAADATVATYDYTGTVTATAPSSQATSGANSPEAALDKNEGNWWHTAWNADLRTTPESRYIQLNLGEATSLDGLRYLTRTSDANDQGDFGNGIVTQYRIEVSTDGTNFTPVSAGAWAPGSHEWRVAVFPESVIAQYVRLYGVRTYGNGEGYANPITRDVNKYMSAAELRLLTGVPDTWRPTNLARLESVTAQDSDHEEGTRDNGEQFNLNGAQAIDGVKTGSEHNNSGHWSTQALPTNNEHLQLPATLTVDLHRMCSVDMVKLFWKHNSVTAYTVEGSADGETWIDIGGNSSRVSAAEAGELVSPAAATEAQTSSASPLQNIRYVRLSVSACDDQGSVHWSNVNLWEIEIYGTAGDLIADTPSVNLTRLPGVTAQASQSETNNQGDGKELDGAAAIDGIKTNVDNVAKPSGHWSTPQNPTKPTTLTVDLHRLCTIETVTLFWKHNAVTAYTVEGSANGTTWTQIGSKSTRVSADEEGETITPTSTLRGIRYVRLSVTNYDAAGSAGWANVNLWEIEIYGTAGDLIETPSVVLSAIRAFDAKEDEGEDEEEKKGALIVQNGKLIVNPKITIPESFTVTFGANLEQVVAPNGTVYTPVVDKVVKIDLTITDNTDPTNTASTPADDPLTVTIPGEHTADQSNGNLKPAVIPEIMEWYSPDDTAIQTSTYTGYMGKSYTLPTAVRIRYRYAFADVANELKADLETLYPDTTVTLTLLNDTEYSTLGNVMQDGDIVLYDVNANSPDNRHRVRGYDDETYGMEIYGGKVYIYATRPTGAYWGTRTLLQGMKLSQGGRSFPNGSLRDYPEFKLRGFMIDVGRKPLSMDMLQTIAKNMAWYKLNDLHIHLNDNLIFMEDYCDGKTYHAGCAASAHMSYQSAYEAYSAFRMESHVQEEQGAKPLTAKDYAYTKDEFKQFIADSAALGVNIVPEFDVPAHAKAITDAFPSLRLNKSGTFAGNTRPWIDHLDLTNKMTQSLEKVQQIFDEYLNGSDPVFSGDVVDFGADEYYDDSSKYAPFAKAMVDYIQGKGKTVRMWGSFSYMGDSQDLFTKEVAKNIQMNIWSTQWAETQAMYDKGFQLININYNPGYIVPNGDNGTGDYGDRLNLTQVDEFRPNNIGGTWVPASSDQMLGGAYAIWQDNIDTRACGLDEVDTFDRFYEGLPLYSERLWGALRSQSTIETVSAKTATAPGTNPYYTPGETDTFAYNFADNTDQSDAHHDLTLTNAELNASRSLLVLKGGASYATPANLGLDRLGWGSQLSFRAFKLSGGGDEQVIFEADHAYGDYAIKALPVADDDTVWRLGFSRELYDYEFEVDLPVGEWVSLTLTNAQQSTVLTYDGTEYPAVGKFVSKPDSNTQFRGKTGITNSSFALPVARIGSKTKAFNGYLAAVSTGAVVQSPLADDKYDIGIEHYTLTAGSEEATDHNGNEGPLSYAKDTNTNTFWHSNHGENLADQPDKRWIQIELDAATPVVRLRYQPRPTVANGIVTKYRVEVSTDGTNFTKVAEGDWAHDTTAKMAVFDSAVTAKYIRLYGVETKGSIDDGPNKFMSCAEIRVCRPIDLTSDGTAKVTFSQASYPLVDGKAEPDPTVTLDGAVLTKDVDYTVAYDSNQAAGRATATITGKGGYVGTLPAAEFEITAPVTVTKTDLSSATVTLPSASYPLVDGKAEPDPTVVLNGDTLMRGLDYTVTYENNTTTGTATVTVTGIGDYTGSVSKTFTVTGAIVKKNLSDAAKTKVTLSQTTYPYDGVAITPEPVVTFDGETLTKGRDYTLSYSRNNAVGTATITVTGAAPYCEGSASTIFTIVEPSKGNDLSDVSKTTITFRPTEYDYTGKPITPTYTVRYNGARLTKDVDFTEELKQNTNGGTGVLVIYGKGDYYGSYVATFTIVGGGAGAGDNSGSSSGSSSSGGGSSVDIPSAIITSTETTKGDGVTTTVKTDSFGGMLAQSNYDNGAKVIADIPVTGPITAVVTVPTRLDTVTVTIPTRGEPTPGQVAVILHPDGTEEIVKTSMPTETGVELTLDASATVQIVDNTKTFIDVSANSWAKDAIDFVTSREIFNGTGNNTFTPSGAMSRAMVCTVLANLAGEDTKGGATWYEKAVDWAKANGVSDGTSPNATVTREQLAAMLYRYAGSPIVLNDVPRRFRDRDAVSGWAEVAMTWAVEHDLIRGRSSNGELDLAPQDTASRAEVAAVFQRYVSLIK